MATRCNPRGRSAAMDVLGRPFVAYRERHPRPEPSPREAGVSAIEYALIAALIAIVIIGAVAFAGNALLAFYELLADWLVWVADRVFDGADAPPPGS